MAKNSGYLQKKFQSIDVYIIFNFFFLLNYRFINFFSILNSNAKKNADHQMAMTKKLFLNA